MAPRAWCNRAHSAVIGTVSPSEEQNVNTHVFFLKFASGQLPFPDPISGTLRASLAELATTSSELAAMPKPASQTGI